MTPREIAKFLVSRRRIAVLSHRDPDGDAVGSTLGLVHILRAAECAAHAYLPGGVPRVYRDVPGADEVRLSLSASDGRPDALVVLDATAPSRLGGLEAELPAAVPVVNIDHHPDNTRFGDHCWVDPGASATALLIHEMATAAGLAVPPAAAESLYVGILTDTGRFTYGNTDARSLRAAGELVTLGADPHRVAVAVYERTTPASVRLLGRALATLELHEGGQVACLHVTRRMLEETGASAEDSDGFSTYARSIDGVKVGLFFREEEGGTVKISFRSNRGVHIDGIAGRFGGGGHASASGARVPGPLEKAKQAVTRAVAEHLRGPAG